MNSITTLNGKNCNRGLAEDFGVSFRLARFEVVFCASFCFLFCILYLVGQQSIFPWVILLMDVLVLSMRKSSVPVLCSALLVGNELASILILLIWMVMSRDISLKLISTCRFDKGVLALISLIFAASFAQAWRAGTIANIILSGTYLLIVAFVAFACSQSITYRRALGSAVCFVIAEFIVSLFICFMNGFEPGDLHYGTLGNAHFIGIACSLFLLLILHAFFKQKVISLTHAFALIAMLAFMMWEADAKAAIGAGFIALCCFLPFWAINKSRTAISIYLWTTVLVFLIGSLALQIQDIETMLTRPDFPLHGFFNEYVYNSGLQNKFDYFMGTTSQMLNDGHIVSGYGLGTYGSRFANMLGYTFTYRDPSAINDLAATLFKSRMIPEYAQFASQYNQSVVDVIHSFSAVMTYPFASLVALIGETGLIGVITVGVILKKSNLSAMSQMCVAFFIGACLTDLYFDHIQTTALLLMMCAAYNQLSRSEYTNGNPSANGIGDAL